VSSGLGKIHKIMVL